MSFIPMEGETLASMRARVEELQKLRATLVRDNDELLARYIDRRVASRSS